MSVFMDHLVSAVRVQFAHDGHLELVQFPGDRELRVLIARCGGSSKLDVQEVSKQLHDAVFAAMPKLQANKKLRRPAYVQPPRNFQRDLSPGLIVRLEDAFRDLAKAHEGVEEDEDDYV